MKSFTVSAFIFTVWAFAITQTMLFPAKVANAAQIPGLKFDNIRSDKLAGVENTEVIVSRVAIPPKTKLPKHWHPGEEFVYILEGSVTLWQEGKAEIVGNAGDVVKVPLKQIHTAITHDEGAVVLVFRVHESGKPERVKVD